VIQIFVLRRICDNIFIELAEKIASGFRKTNMEPGIAIPVFSAIIFLFFLNSRVRAIFSVPSRMLLSVAFISAFFLSFFPASLSVRRRGPNVHRSHLRETERLQPHILLRVVSPGSHSTFWTRKRERAGKRLSRQTYPITLCMS
jgi:hypothetical protein